MNIEKINEILNQIFAGLSISNINYSIDFWVFEFDRHFGDKHYKSKKLNKLKLTAYEIEIPNEKDWQTLISKGPFDISDSVDFEESIKALIIFHLARLPIDSIQINKNSDLIFNYTESRFLKIKGLISVTDWIWSLDIENNEKIIMSEFGKIVCDETLLKSILE